MFPQTPFTLYDRLSNKLVEQLAALCKQTFNRLSNRFDNRMYRVTVNGV